MNGDQTSWRSLMLADEVAVSGGVPFPYTADQYFKDDVGEVSFESVYDSFTKQSDEPSSAASINNRCLLVRKLSDALRETCESEKQVNKSALLATASDNQKFNEFQTFSSREDESSVQTREPNQKVEFCIGDHSESERSASQLQATDSSGSSRQPCMSSVELVELFFHLSADDDSAVRAESLDSLPSFLEAFKRGWPQIDAALQRRSTRKLNTNGYYGLVLANGSGSEIRRDGRRCAEAETEGEAEAEARLGNGALFVPIVVHGLCDESNEQVRKNALAALERIAERKLFPARSSVVEQHLLEALVEPLRRKSAFEMPPCSGPVGVRRMSSRSSPTLASAVDNDESIRIGSLKLIGKLTETGLVSNSALRRHFEDAFKRACSDPSMAVRRQCASLFCVFSCLLDNDDHGTRGQLETDAHSEDDVFDGDGDIQGCGCARQRRNATCRSRKTESFKSGSDVLGVCVGAGSVGGVRPSLLDCFVALCADANLQVRRECAVAFVAVAQHVTVNVRRTSLTRAFVRLLDDTAAYNRCVQQAAYAHLGTFISMMTDDADCESHADCDATEDTSCEQMVVSDAEKLRGTSGVDPSALMLLLSATDECAFDLLAQRLQLTRKVHGFELLPGNDDSGDPFSCTSPAVDTWPNALSATTSQTPTPTPTSRASQSQSQSQSGSGSPRSRPSHHFLFDLVRYEQLRTYLCLPPPFTLTDVLTAAGSEYERTLTDLLVRAARFPLLARSAVLCDSSSSASNAQCLYDCVPSTASVNSDADQFQSVPVTFDCAPQCVESDSAMRELQCQVDATSEADADADADATQQLNATSGAQAQHSVTFEQRFKALLHCLLADATDGDPADTETLVDADEADSSGRYALISGVPRILIEYFVGMLDAERNESSANNPAESDLIRHCAETLPNVVRALTASTSRSASGASTWPRCRLLLFALACSANWRVRRTVAQSLAELARCVGESYASRDLLAVFCEFVRENLDEVKAGLAECLAALISLVNPTARRELLSRVAHLFTQENARNWRVRRGLLAQLARLASDHLIPLNAFVDTHMAAPPEVHGDTSFRFVDTGFSPMQLLRDAVYEVRVAAYHLVATLLELADVSSSSSSDLSNALLRNAQLLVFEQSATGERRLSASYRDRQSYVQLVAVVCDRGTLLTPGCTPLVDELLAPALALANDRIVNVRISLADLLANANLLAFFNTSRSCVYPDALLAAYRTLLADPSVDVRDLVAGAIASQASLLAALAFAAGPQPATSND